DAGALPRTARVELHEATGGFRAIDRAPDVAGRGDEARRVDPDAQVGVGVLRELVHALIRVGAEIDPGHVGGAAVRRDADAGLTVLLEPRVADLQLRTREQRQAVVAIEVRTDGQERVGRVWREQ